MHIAQYSNKHIIISQQYLRYFFKIDPDFMRTLYIQLSRVMNQVLSYFSFIDMFHCYISLGREKLFFSLRRKYISLQILIILKPIFTPMMEKCLTSPFTHNLQQSLHRYRHHRKNTALSQLQLRQIHNIQRLIFSLIK